ncbi:putative mitochondrial protein AtMg00310 [Silene latifolia]|uniref:putative mitochondrial protein AtMg00310 n=1 Tax=Silene latifolia TaxID=37657 RepID=UPI003D77102A
MGGLGFRDFHKMNQALLGKQAWRLLTSQNCLWARLMQSKYYQGKSFLEAEMGGNPSYTWRGILGAREVILKGLRRRIGYGGDTYVWRDAWMPDTQTGMVVSPCVGGNPMMCVADLMTNEGRAWDEK